jgi:integrase
MPKLVNKVPRYCLHKPSGQARVWWKEKAVYLGKFGSPESKDAYARFLASIGKPAASALPEPGQGEVVTVAEIVLRYYKHARVYYCRAGVPTGEHVTVRSCLRPLEKRFGGICASEFGPKKLKVLQEDMIGLGWSRRYINKAVGIVKRCFRWAASEELLPGRVATDIWAVRGLEEHRSGAREKPEVGPVSDEHIEAVLPLVSEVVADSLRLMRLTGTRPGEVMTMKAAEIDRSDPSCWVYHPGHHKNSHRGKARVVFIGARAQEIILPRLLKAGPDGLLFPMDRTSLRRAVQRGCKRAGIPDWAPNQIRHTFGTEVRAKHGLEAAQVLLGHSRADVTQTYAERDLAKAAEVARMIG